MTKGARVTELWEVKENCTTRLWLELQGQRGEYEAIVKWDGCVEFYRFFNGTTSCEEDDYDHIHICDIDDCIARLQALKEIAKGHFGGDWNDE